MAHALSICPKNSTLHNHTPLCLSWLDAMSNNAPLLPAFWLTIFQTRVAF